MKLKAFFKKILAKVFLKLYDASHGQSRLSAYGKTHLPIRDLIFKKGVLYKDITYYANGQTKQIIKFDQGKGHIQVDYYENGVPSRIEIADKTIAPKPIWFTFTPEGELFSYRASRILDAEQAKKLAQCANNRR